MGRARYVLPCPTCQATRRRRIILELEAGELERVVTCDACDRVLYRWPIPPPE